MHVAVSRRRAPLGEWGWGMGKRRAAPPSAATAAAGNNLSSDSRVLYFFSEEGVGGDGAWARPGEGTVADCKRAVVGVTRLIQKVDDIGRRMAAVETLLLEKREFEIRSVRLRRLQSLEQFQEAEKVLADQAMRVSWVSFWTTCMNIWQTDVPTHVIMFFSYPIMWMLLCDTIYRFVRNSALFQDCGVLLAAF